MIHLRGLVLLLLLQFASLFDESQAQDYGGNSSISLRLVNPSSTATSNDTMEGRLEVYYNGTWGTVCDDSFSDAGARVVCASLGFGRAGRFIANSYGPGNGTIWLDDVRCNGTELSITDCSHSSWGTHNCNHGEDVSIRCVNSSILPRLVNPNSNTMSKDTLEGRLEIYYNGVWGTVCDNYFTDAGARVVCATLGFGRTGRFISNSYGPGTGTIFLYDAQCNANELNITDCFYSSLGTNNCGHNQDVAIRCSNSSIFIRLFNPNSTTTSNVIAEGRLEIYYNGVWGRVCANSFSDNGAQVVCANLGFGRTGRFIPNSFGPGNGSIMLDYVQCTGYEQSITDCQHSRWVSNNYCYYEDVAIRCSDSTIFTRLFNPNLNTTSNTTMEGRLEIYYNGLWGRVCSNSFSDNGAHVVCASLGFGRTGRFIRNSYGPGNGPILLDYVQCNGNEQSITDCSHSRWGSNNYCYDEDVAISCRNSSILTRLVNPNSNTTSYDTFEGRLEIYHDGVWGTVCDDYFTDKGAQVVCASLGFGRTGRFIRNSYGNGTVLLDSVRCNGNEQNITDCPHSRWGSSNCGQNEIVSVRCSNSSIFLRLFNLNSTTTNNNKTLEGRLEIYYNGVWGKVCANGFTDTEAQVVCASLGFGREGRFIPNSYGRGNGPILLDNVKCSGYEQSITDCQHSRWGSSYNCYDEDVAIRCRNSSVFIRLVNPNSNTTGNDTLEGRLEVYYNGVWGTVCNNSFTNAIAQVFCASLGFRRQGRFIRNAYGPGNGTIMLDNVRCKGNELSITDCQHSRWGSSNCSHDEDVAISCSNSSIFLRLFNPNSRTTSNDTMEGRLEIYYNGVWGTVCDDSFSDAGARVVCASLGFGRIGSFIANSYGPGSGTILLDDVRCNGYELSITDCLSSGWYIHDCSHNEDISISCTSVTGIPPASSLKAFKPDTTTFPYKATTPFRTNGKIQTTTFSTSKPATLFIMTSKPTISTTNTQKTTTLSLIETSKATTGVVSTLGHTAQKATTLRSHIVLINTSKATTGVVSSLGHTTQKVTTHNSPISLIETSETTTGVVSSLGPTTQKTTTLRSPTVLIETSKATTKVVSSLDNTTPEATTTAVKIASNEMKTTYDVSSISTTLKTTASNRNECDSSPCLHAATCVDLVSDYRCSCSLGFTGRNCETELDPCETVLCVNGTCITDNNTSTCECIEGYRGHFCDEDIAECDSYPCQHDSTCIDGLNSYQCQCLGGYTGRNCETDVNECESNPCSINATCEDSINRYQCICPNPDEYIGIHCNITVLPPEKSDSPKFAETWPKYGPISGGTKITIRGRNLDKYGGIFFVYIGKMKLPIKNWTSSWSEFFVVTTAGESSFVGVDQQLTFEITGGKNISSNLTFTYQPDPEIEDVKPTEHLASGGTTLTIIGNHLNSSASPYLRVILNTTTPGRRNRNITIINGPTCNANSSNEIYCLMPRVNVTGNTVAYQPVKGRRKRRAEESSPNITTYLTLILKSDGAEDAPNKSIEYTVYKGNLTSVSGPVSFNPEHDEFIHIQGGDLNIGIEVNDYEIFVGAGGCTNKTLTVNELSCRPPTEEPGPGSEQATYCSESGGLPVIVFAGRKVDDGDRIKLKWACLIYPRTFSWWIVGAICGGCGLLLVLTIACSVLCRRRLKRLREASKQRVFSATHPSDDNMDPAKPDWMKLQVNAQGKPKSKSRSIRNYTYASRFTNDFRLNSYQNDLTMREFRPHDSNSTLSSEWTINKFSMDERGRHLIQNELDMMAAERNARGLHKPVRYSYGLLSDDDFKDAPSHDSSDYVNYQAGSEFSSISDWRNQRRRMRPTTQRQFGGTWKATDDDAISLAPALRANLGMIGSFNSPLFGSIELPTTSDSTDHRVGHY